MTNLQRVSIAARVKEGVLAHLPRAAPKALEAQRRLPLLKRDRSLQPGLRSIPRSGNAVGLRLVRRYRGHQHKRRVMLRKLAGLRNPLFLLVDRSASPQEMIGSSF